MDVFRLFLRCCAWRSVFLMVNAKIPAKKISHKKAEIKCDIYIYKQIPERKCLVCRSDEEYNLWWKNVLKNAFCCFYRSQNIKKMVFGKLFFPSNFPETVLHRVSIWRPDPEIIWLGMCSNIGLATWWFGRRSYGGTASCDPPVDQVLTGVILSQRVTSPDATTILPQLGSIRGFPDAWGSRISFLVGPR